MIIITVIALFLTQFEEDPYVIHAFAGIRACVCVLILDAVVKLGKKWIKDKRTTCDASSASFSSLSSLPSLPSSPSSLPASRYY